MEFQYIVVISAVLLAAALPFVIAKAMNAYDKSLASRPFEELMRLANLRLSTEKNIKIYIATPDLTTLMSPVLQYYKSGVDMTTATQLQPELDAGQYIYPVELASGHKISISAPIVLEDFSAELYLDDIHMGTANFVEIQTLKNWLGSAQYKITLDWSSRRIEIENGKMVEDNHVIGRFKSLNRWSHITVFAFESDISNDLSHMLMILAKLEDFRRPRPSNS